MNNKKFLIIYGVIIFIALIAILFILPDKTFLKDKKGYEEFIKSAEEQKYESLETQKENLLKNKYDYEYNVIHNTKQYVCTGTKKEDTESGRCTSPKSMSYTEKDKFDEDKLYEIKFVEPEHIFKRIKDLEYTQSIINDEKVYTFKTKISEFDTTIRIYTGRKNISRIDIENGVMTYILKYKNIKS